MTTRESFHLDVARDAFIRGNIGIDEYEHAVEHVLRGGHLTQDARPAPGDGAFNESPFLDVYETRGPRKGRITRKESA